MKRFIRLFVGVICVLYASAVTLLLAARWVLGDRVGLLALLADFTPFYFAPLIGLIPLALITRTRTGLAWLAGTTAIGALLIGRWYLPKNNPPPSAHAITITAFNVLHRNPTLLDAVRWAAREADILFLEELPEAYADGIDDLEAEFPYHRYNHTNAIYSRYPFDSSTDGIFPAVIVLDGQAVALYSVHAPLPLSSYERFTFLQMAEHYNPRLRDASLMPLLEAVQSETRPFIVAGDFNMTEFATMYGWLSARMTDSYREAGIGLGLTWPLWYNVPMVRIDYVWHSRQFRAVSASRDLTPSGSDHAPLTVTLDWRAE